LERIEIAAFRTPKASLAVWCLLNIQHFAEGEACGSVITVEDKEVKSGAGNAFSAAAGSNE